MRIRKSELKELIQEVITEATGVWGDEIAPGQLPKNMQKKAEQATALMMGGGSKSPKRIEVEGWKYQLVAFLIFLIIAIENLLKKFEKTEFHTFGDPWLKKTSGWLADIFFGAIRYDKIRYDTI